MINLFYGWFPVCLDDDTEYHVDGLFIRADEN